MAVSPEGDPVMLDGFLLLTVAGAAGPVLTFLLRRHGIFVAGMALLLPLAAAVALFCAADHVLLSPGFDFNNGRLAPAAAWVRGYRLYYPATEGPVLNVIYGPVSAVAYLPAALLGDPGRAVMAGSLIAALWVSIPAFLLMVPAGGTSVTRRVVGIAAGALFLVACCQTPALTYSVFKVHADAPAIGLVLASVLLVLGPGAPGRGRTPGAASCAVLACWAKQTIFPAAAGLLIITRAAHGRPGLRALLPAYVVAGAVISVTFLFAFGQDMLFNMFTIPSKHALRGGALEIVTVGGELFARRAALPFLVLVAAGAVARGRLPARSRACALLALLLVPTALMGWAKVGGFINSFGPPIALLWIAALAAWADLAALPDAGSPWARRLARAGWLLAVTFVLWQWAIAVSWRTLSFPPVRSPLDDAYDFARRRPGEVTFPWFPLATLLATGELHHFEHGVVDRDLAGFPVTPDHYARHTTRPLRRVAYLPAQERPCLDLAGPWTPVVEPELPAFQVLEQPAP